VAERLKPPTTPAGALEPSPAADLTEAARGSQGAAAPQPGAVIGGEGQPEESHLGQGAGGPTLPDGGDEGALDWGGDAD
jgi:hypothetical protein